jgi:hypothetical protein
MTKTVNNTASETAQLASTHASPHLNSESWVPVVPSPHIPPVYRLYLARRDSADARRFRPSSFARRAKCQWRIPCHTSRVYEAIGAALSPTPTWDTDVNTDDAGLVSCVHMHSSWLVGRQIDR